MSEKPNIFNKINDLHQKVQVQRFSQNVDDAHHPSLITSKPTRNAKEANGLVASCSSLFRREQTLIPQGAHWQSDRQGLTVCIKEITCHLYKTRFQAMRADEPMATSEGYLILSRQKSIPSPYWLNGTLLPDVRPTAGKCQVDSR